LETLILAQAGPVSARVTFPGGTLQYLSIDAQSETFLARACDSRMTEPE